MKFWGPLSALLLVLVSPRAQEPAPPIEDTNRSPDGAISQQSEDSGGEATLVFPDYVDGSGWSVQLALSNVDPDAAAQVQIEVYGQTGRAVADLFVAESAAEIPPLGSRVWRSAGEGEIRRGWIEVRTGSEAVSGLLTYRDARSGIEVGVNPVELGQQFALSVEESPAVGSGVAIFKPEGASGVQLRLRDEEGYDPLEGEFVRWGDFRQGARTLPEWIGVEHVDTDFLEDFRGLLFLETEDGSPLIPLGLRFGKEVSSLSAVPVIRNSNPVLQETVLVFPDYVDGGGWSVQLVISNVDAAVGAEAAVEVYDQEGEAVRDLFDAESAVEIPSLGSRVWSSTGEGAIRRGWIEVRTGSEAVSGLLTYRDTRSGIEVGVNPVELGQRFALFVEESPTAGAGVAIYKREAASGVELRLRDEEGNDPLEGGSVRWEDFRQAARTLPEWFDVDGADTAFLEDFRGLLLVESDEESALTPLGLRFGKGTSSLSAVPAIRIAEEEADGGEVLSPTVTLSVSRTRIDWGQSATLRWSSTNAESVTIEPDIGAVSPSGSRSVSPRGTTTYRITARGADGQTATASVTVGVIVSQRAALQALYDALGGPDWTHSGNWGTGAPLEDWHGVQVDDQGRVTGLRLVHRTAEGQATGIGLTGEIPPELGALTHLVVLDLSRNELTGGIPAQLGTLSHLEFLNLSGNRLTGPIPAQLGNVIQLTHLYLGANELTGGVPVQLGNLTQLIHLALHQNDLTGAIPEQLGNLTQLTFLALGANRLTGAIPRQLGDLSQLIRLYLDANRLTGPIPPQLGNLTLLNRLYLNENELTGEIPAELGNLSRLEFLYLFSNRLTGPIPPELGNLSQLTRLHLDGNELTGGIPEQLGNLSHLEFLYLFSNRLTGPIPEQLGNLIQLTRLALGANELTGGIPAQLGNLSRLEFLSLASNDLTGPTPEQLGNLSQLTLLSLRGNELTDPIPPSVLQLEQLEYFRFDGNAGLCAPGTAGFYDWLTGIEQHRGPFCNESDVAVIESLYEATGGTDWTNSDGWLGKGAVSQWHGVQADSLGRVTGLDLSGNGLEGRVPGNLSQLSRMTVLRIGGNALSGRLPLGLTRLPLQEFDYSDTELCAPAEAQFQAWLDTVASHDGTGTECAPATDRDLLVEIYDATGGPNWIHKENWLTDAPLGEWSGITVGGDGRVTGLNLPRNDLTGAIPPELGNLSQLIQLQLENNELTGAIPPELGNLSQLKFLTLNGNRLTGSIPEQLGNLLQLQYLYLNDNQLTGSIPEQLESLSELIFLLLYGNRLTGSIPEQLGLLSGLQGLYLSGNRLTGPIPPELGSLSQLKFLFLSGNQLTGSIPEQLGSLSGLQGLYLSRNRLTGPIPPELGSFSNLQWLDLSGNQLRGEIPAQLGNLSQLKSLVLYDNRLTGEIPPQLENLTQLESLVLYDNQLTGLIPARLGKLTRLESLVLDGNRLRGPIPPELGGLAELRALSLSRNAGISGAVPGRLEGLSRLEEVLAGDTRLCAPVDASARNWLKGAWKRRVDPCSRGLLPRAYLTQAVQSREFPVPLVAGEKALLRVFVTAPEGSTGRFPPVRARFYVRGRERHVLEIPGKPTPIPAEVNEGSLSITANAEVPGEIVQPGLEMVIEIDPEGTLRSVPGLTKRIPETGRRAVEVRSMPTFDLTLIPFLWRKGPDKSILELVNAMARGPGSHELLWATRTLLPIGDLEVTAHEPVLSHRNNAFTLLAETEAIRVMEGGTGYYMGMMPAPVTGASGVAFRPGKSSFAIPHEWPMAHELGHNLNLGHTPCGTFRTFLDPSFPDTRGSIGAWGYDFREGGRLVPSGRSDLMGYCAPWWISDYHFTNMLRFRLHTAATSGMSSLVAAPARSLLLWGGVDAGGTPFLEPAFVVKAPASLPHSTGEYRIMGRNADGDELFSLTFEMPEVADGDGGSSFAFVLPVQPAWADQLAGIILSGPGGPAALDRDADRPVSILRNPRSGQIRGILRGSAASGLARDDAVSALIREPGLEVMTSRGIPDREDWTR